MKPKQAIITGTLFSCFVFSLGLVAQQSTTYKGKQYAYTIFYDTSKCHDTFNTIVDSIVIKDKATGMKTQTLPVTSDGIPCNGDLMKADEFKIVDANFDGYEDILLMQFLPAAPNIPYFWWMYNPKTKLFAEDTALENISSPQFDSASHTIYSQWRGSCCDHGNDTYEFQNGKAVLIEQNEDIYDPVSKTDTLFTRKLVNGKLIEVSKSVGKDNDN